MISSEQREFIDACVYEHDGNVQRTATALGIPPRVVYGWFEDVMFDAEMRRTKYIRLSALGYDQFSLALKLLSIINANIADVANIESMSEIGELPPNISYAIQSFKRSFDPQLGDTTVEIKHHDKLKALIKAIETLAPALQNDAAMLGGQDDARLDGVSLELPYEVLEERGLLPPKAQDALPKPDLDAQMDDWLDE